ncbi:MAG: aminotransferase class I/II-fold pyridoxal phosphate-dependent enzyme [Holophagaceae bacterium]|nr:aminotransferase class I/II-fold pyridoxal phosphate-dependent enzyme [Holophagaceae bacterium]
MTTHPEALDRNARIQAINPVVLEALSPLGHRAFFPKGIPYQAGQAKACSINATIGQITDGAGNPIPLAPLAEKLAGLNPKDAFLYAPISGREAARKLWHAKLVKEDARMEKVGLPVAGAGVCHALNMASELFFAPGDTLVVPDLYWDNYEQVFQVRLQGDFLPFPFYGEGGGFNIAGLRETLASVPGKVHVLLNFPSNPNGYSPTPEELVAIGNVLVEAAEKRPVVVYCDDAYHGLVFEPSATTKSLFYELIDRSPNLIPLKCDGATKELSFFGGRVAFLHFGVDKAIAEILVDKCMGLIRSGLGGTVGLSQHLVELELQDERHEGEFERLRLILAGRYQRLKAALAKPSPYWTVYPFNAGCFCLLKLRDGLDADQIRQQLIAEEGVGVVSQQGNCIRIAFCSIKEESVVPLIEALERVCAKR